MKKNKNETREIPAKNYFVVLIVSILVVVLAFYVRSIYLNYQSYNSDTSIFEDKSINQINIDDIDYAVNETNEGFIFVSYNGETKISIMERRLYREIEKKNLNDRMLYLNITEDKEAMLGTLRKKFSDFAVDIKEAPLLIYIKDGKCVEIIDSSINLISYNTLDTLLSKYGIE